jgi:hypothetical protein
MSFALVNSIMLRRHLPLVILLLSLLFAAHDYHAGLQSDEVAVCEAENCWQESEAESTWFDASDGNQPMASVLYAGNCIHWHSYRIQIRRSFSPFPGRRLYLQFRQLRTDC